LHIRLQGGVIQEPWETSSGEQQSYHLLAQIPTPQCLQQAYQMSSDGLMQMKVSLQGKTLEKRAEMPGKWTLNGPGLTTRQPIHLLLSTEIHLRQNG
jgi:hypothetical protein